MVERDCGSGANSTTMTFLPVTLFVLDDRKKVHINAVCRNYNGYRKMTVALGPTIGVHLDTVFDQDLL